MTYVELILLIEERKEKLVSNGISQVQTDGHTYLRAPDGQWHEKPVLLEREEIGSKLSTGNVAML